MGLASKMAASMPPGGAPQQQPQYGQQSAPPAQQYQPYSNAAATAPYGNAPGRPAAPGQAPGQAPPQPSYPGAAPGYGQRPPQPPYPSGPGSGGYAQPTYGGPPSGAPPAGDFQQEVPAYRAALERAVDEKNLRRFYPAGSPAIASIAQTGPAKIASLCRNWNVPPEVGRDLIRLGLYDIILFIDDSGSMQFEEAGSRIDDMKTIVDYAAQAATMFDDDGISVRFMNNQLGAGTGDNISNKAQIEQMIASIKFAGLTPLGTELRRKVVDDIVLRAARSNSLRKPVLVITVTDGQPAQDGPDNHAVFDTVKYAVAEVQRATGTTGGIAFQFAQVGNDKKARDFLGKLDSDSTVGAMVDCTSNYENEQQEMLQQNPPVDLTPSLWVVKLLMGAIDPSYDSKDETRSYRPGGPGGSSGPGSLGVPGGQSGYGRPPPPPPPQYGQPQSQYGNPGGYGQPQSQYGNPQGYGQQPQYGNPGGYGQQQQQQPQYSQGGYGAPPGYPQQNQQYNQQGYGAPPPPPRY